MNELFTVKQEKISDMAFDTAAGNPARTYKDRLFRMLFKDKTNFLELYNAMNGTAYDNPDDLTVTTLENAIYISMKNDISYLLYDQLTLYEHQSTRNPNLPLRNLFYVSNIYSELVSSENLYGSKQIKIPEPVFIVFYNGKDEMAEHSFLQLSDAYTHSSANIALELKVQILNINPGYNQELMEKCKVLRDYSIFVSKAREYSNFLPFAQAVEKAIETCIHENILKEFLQKNRAEVLSVSIFEYNEELHMQQEREYAMEQGIQKGELLMLISQIKKKRMRMLSPEEISKALEEDLPRVEQIVALIDGNPAADQTELYDLWIKQSK
ncbi:MAG: hypothetical protein Q4C61_16635 [Lachnospiraceae bacterium]|nr:hypothetical protein [Lachnospiraceae bacterium]